MRAVAEVEGVIPRGFRVDMRAVAEVGGVIPRGFRFTPTDEDLLYYLSGRVSDSWIPNGVVIDFDVYGCDPWNLPRRQFGYQRNMGEMYFFTRLRRVSSSSESKKCGRFVRTAGSGVWHGNGKEKIIKDDEGRVVGHTNSFTFRVAFNDNDDDKIRKKRRVNAHWIMHEFKFQNNGVDDLVVCKIYEKKRKSSEDESGKGTSSLTAISQGEEVMGMMRQQQIINRKQAEEEPSNSSTTTLTEQYNHPPFLIDYSDNGNLASTIAQGEEVMGMMQQQQIICDSVLLSLIEFGNSKNFNDAVKGRKEEKEMSEKRVDMRRAVAEVEGIIPVGFRFTPTDEDLLYYLSCRVSNSWLPNGIVVDFDVYRCDPWNLPCEQFRYQRNLGEMYFFTRLRRVSSSSESKKCGRFVRTAGSGVWHGNGKEKIVKDDEGRFVGHTNSFTFMVAFNDNDYDKIRKKRRVNAHWIMHEFKLQNSGVDDLVVCKIYEKKRKSSEDEPGKVNSFPATISREEEVMGRMQQIINRKQAEEEPSNSLSTTPLTEHYNHPQPLIDYSDTGNPASTIAQGEEVMGMMQQQIINRKRAEEEPSYSLATVPLTEHYNHPQPLVDYADTGTPASTIAQGEEANDQKMLYQSSSVKRRKVNDVDHPSNSWTIVPLFDHQPIGPDEESMPNEGSIATLVTPLASSTCAPSTENQMIDNISVLEHGYWYENPNPIYKDYPVPLSPLSTFQLSPQEAEFEASPLYEDDLGLDQLMFDCEESGSPALVQESLWIHEHHHLFSPPSSFSFPFPHL